VRLALTELGAL